MNAAPLDRIDPFPERLEPMYAIVATTLPRDAERWAFEYKWDGIRAMLYHRDRVTLMSRNRIDITHQYPELEALAAQLDEPTVLDGEIVAIDADGRPNFSLLQQRMHVASRRIALSRMRQVFVTYMIFDVLYHGTKLLLGLPYHERRARLEAFELEGTNWRTPPAYQGIGHDVLEAARGAGMEGIVAKQLQSPYRPGQRSGEWLKIKVRARQEFVVGGWTPLRGQPGGTLGAMLVGYYRDNKLHYAGSVGTGLTDQDRRQLKRLFESHRVEKSPFVEPTPRMARFTEPRYVAEVEFSDWTPGGSLRQPSYKGLRFDKDPRQVVRE